MVEQLMEDIRSSGSNIFDLTLIRDGEWEHGTLIPTAPCQNNYSVTKSYIATGIGLLQDMGKLSVEDPILKFFKKEELPADMDPKMEQVKVRHLLNQTPGIGEGFLFEGDRYTHGTDNWLTYTLSRPLVHEPGTQFTYSNSHFYLLSCIIHRVSGLTADDFLRRYLFAPLGIEDFAFAACPMGETQGGTGLYLSTDDNAKVGALYLNKGVFNGKRVLSEEWVAQATQNQVRLSGQPAYGYGFWMNDAGFEGSGAYCQMILVSPEKQVVLAAHAFTESYDYIGLLRRHGVL